MILYYLDKLDGCSWDTKVFLIIALIISAFILYQILKFLTPIFKSFFDLNTLMKLIKLLITVVRDYEVKVWAGFINIFLSVILLIITVGIFLSASIASIIGFGDNITVAKIGFLIITIIGIFTSLWLLKEYHKLKLLH